MRLSETARGLGLLDDVRWDAFCRKRDAVSRETERLRSIWVNPKNLAVEEASRVLGKEIEHEYSLAELLRRPDVGYRALMSLGGGQYASPELPVADSPHTGDSSSAPDAGAAFIDAVLEQVETNAKYAGYIDRQRQEIDRATHYEHLKLPADLDYLQVSALGFEAKQILARQRPETLGLASRISGITPAAISLLMVHLKKSRGRKQGSTGSASKTGIPDDVQI